MKSISGTRVADEKADEEAMSRERERGRVGEEGKREMAAIIGCGDIGETLEEL